MQLHIAVMRYLIESGRFWNRISRDAKALGALLPGIIEIFQLQSSGFFAMCSMFPITVVCLRVPWLHLCRAEAFFPCPCLRF